jgi:hypothetical protein
MNDRDRILQETTGLAAGVIVGAIALVVGRLLFSNSLVPVYTGNWVQTNYDPAALTVLAVSTVFAIFWYLITLNWWLTYKPEKAPSAKSVWALLSVFPILSFVVAVFYWGKDGGAALGSSAFFTLSITLGSAILFSYWMATALSTPGNMSSVVPLASLIRR